MKKKKGFTLVELLVVLVIIGIIIALILPNTLRAIQEANERECSSHLRAIDTAVQLCYTSERVWANCNDVGVLVTGEYLDVAPECPFGIAYTITGDDVSGWEAQVLGAHFPSKSSKGVDHL